MRFSCRKMVMILMNSVFAINHTFEFKEELMLLDGEVFWMYAGEMHPARIPYQYWRHRV